MRRPEKAPYDTLIINESNQKDKEKKSKDKKKIDYVYFMENDKFIYDDLKYLELIIKDNIDNEEKKEPKVKNNKIIIPKKKSSNKNMNSNKKENTKIKNKISFSKTDYNYFEQKKHKTIKSKEKKKSITNSPYSKPQLSYLKISSSVPKKSERNKLSNNCVTMYETLMKSVPDDEIINNNKPIKMCFHENNISSINSRNEKSEENIKDSDDEGTINLNSINKDYCYKTLQNHRKTFNKNKSIFYEINVSNNLYINVCNNNNDKNYQKKIIGNLDNKKSQIIRTNCNRNINLFQMHDKYLK